MIIKSAMDWDAVSDKLLRQISTIKNGRKRIEASKVLANIEGMITKLSQLELQARRSSSHSPRLVNEQLDIINQSVLELEQWITLLLLS